MEEGVDKMNNDQLDKQMALFVFKWGRVRFHVVK